ncbi:MAG: hypothetical protein ACRDSO_02805, partial [Pseudonocardiaceae bacterium]
MVDAVHVEAMGGADEEVSAPAPGRPGTDMATVEAGGKGQEVGVGAAVGRRALARPRSPRSVGAWPL